MSLEPKDDEKGSAKLRVIERFNTEVTPKFVRYKVNGSFEVPGSTAMGDCCDPQVDPIIETENNKLGE
ncbi:MAG: hypothetical protein ABSB40_07040 [Nitrososphaeria archaeon]|jgi:hypothetical protein